jgi:hypothetical protein
MVYIYVENNEEYTEINDWLKANDLSVDLFFIKENQEHGARVAAHGMATFPVLFDVTPNPSGGESLKIFAQGPGAIKALNADVAAQIKAAIVAATTPAASQPGPAPAQ